MTGSSDNRTRAVFWLKVLLPLVALALLSTLFLLARSTDPDLAIRYSEVDVTELSKDQQVKAPTYSGITRDGAAIRVTAAAVRPQPADPLKLDATTVAGRVDLRGGASADMVAPAAVIDTDADLARFLGGVTIVSSDGYRIETATLSAALDETDIVAESEVHAVGSFGTLDAGTMRITQDADGGYVLVFTGGVRLIYDPVQGQE